jgi:hypothetical protein
MDYNHEFTITISGRGKTVNEAWINAVTALDMNMGEYPEEYNVLNEDDEECEPYNTDNGRFFTDPLYWDCSCKDNYIHLKTNGNFCPLCCCEEEDMADARVNEIQEKYDPNLDTAVQDPPIK